MLVIFSLILAAGTAVMGAALWFVKIMRDFMGLTGSSRRKRRK